jgi:DNA ligase-1
VANFEQLAALAEEMAGTSSRLAKRAAISAAIRAVRTQERVNPTSGEQPPEMGHPGIADDTGLFCLYLAGLPFAEADSRKLNAGGTLLSKAVLAVSDTTEAELSAAYRRHGDLGAAAFELLDPMSQKRDMGHPVMLSEVYEAFSAMAAARTTLVRAALVEGLLRRATPLEAKYLLKLMLGDMRIGVKQSLVEEAIAAAAGASVAAVRRAVMLEADLGSAAQRAFAGTLAEARMRLFHPLGFMLASPVETPEEAIERFKTGETGSVQAFLEDKYDGMRAQLHCAGGRVALFSRNREPIGDSFPELVEAFAAASVASGDGLILDGEILAWDYTTAQALPFAVLSQRIGRKRVDNPLRQRIPAVFMAFDLLFAADELLLERPLRERRNLLEARVERLSSTAQSPLILHERKPQASLFDPDPPAEPTLPRLLLAPSRLVQTAEEIDRAYADARARANEGVMLKAAASAYEPGRRGIWWVKLKRELATLDVVVTGAEYGHGRRAGLLSDYTFAVRDAAGELRNVGKAYSGLTDAEIAELTEWMKAHTLEDFGHFRTVEPLMVLEVAFNNIMRGDRHASGFALRFPRIVRIRTDKPVAEIDTVERVAAIYKSQVDKPLEP